ncbi:ABC transporter ATP-binding protein [Amorphus sp. MBR-141]
MTDAATKVVPALALAGVERSYREGEGRLTVLRGIDLILQPGELVALVAPSGAGKSTLLHIAALLERADAGKVSIGGVDTTGLGDGARTDLRRSSIGMIYQFHHLLPDFTALENVTLPMRLAGAGKREAEAAAMALLDELGVAPRASHRPGELSGGERQRVAIARAVANRPAVLLADEPTGNLDPATAEHVFAAFVRLARSTGLAALVATHNHELAARMDRRVTLVDGRCETM